MHFEEISKKQAEVEIINSIKHSHKDLRQLSKGPTFCLTYNGTYKALMEIFGFSKEEALSISASEMSCKSSPMSYINPKNMG